VSSIKEVGDPTDHTAAIEVWIVRIHVQESILMLGRRHHVDPYRWRPLIMNSLKQLPRNFFGLPVAPTLIDWNRLYEWLDRMNEHREAASFPLFDAHRATSDLA
jgi:hypothetical protein